ncbi:nucleotide-binding universal stress UspA family protein [Microbacterium proteolyticum]|uniref:Nucleotide-binding universal stress UspA family protein n=1 Tax=Microbacterium proteolyticum TaxID=1572644 RepID=A0A7W5CIH6_9MICO|nr:universal stress protein [Microbacterium proteolyticum]MBB3158327.1 nucleotide-binding universal stress UspA family protein [Microbacterium proteolyticum]
MDHMLLGFDGSEASVAALEWVAQRARHVPSHVTLTSVAELFESERELRRVSEEGADLLRKLAPSVAVETKVIRGWMPGALLESEQAADLVVIGSHLYAPVRSTLKGWVPLRVSVAAAIPSCIVPSGWRERPGPVIVGYDGDGSADAALHFAASEAARTERKLLIVHAWPIKMLRKRNESAHQEMLEEAVRTVSRAYPGLLTEHILMADDPALVLGALARDASLVVIGSHHHGALAGGLLGTVAWYLVGSMTSPLCVVPPEFLPPLEMNSDVEPAHTSTTA